MCIPSLPFPLSPSLSPLLSHTIGVVSLARELADGLHLFRVSCPIGVLCVVFESRPEVVVQVSVLAIMSGNAVILKGGKEATHSNAVLFSLIRSALSTHGLPAHAVSLLSSREALEQLLPLDSYIDMIIARGGPGLVKAVRSGTKIPVVAHAAGTFLFS